MNLSKIEKTVQSLCKRYQIKAEVMGVYEARKAGFEAGWIFINHREPYDIELLISDTELLFSFNNTFSTLLMISSNSDIEISRLIEDYTGGFLHYGVYSKSTKSMLGRIKTKRYVRTISGKEWIVK
jgi:hypothetical protein